MFTFFLNLNAIVEKVLKVGDKITDDYTRDEYNRLAR